MAIAQIVTINVQLNPVQFMKIAQEVVYACRQNYFVVIMFLKELKL